MALFKICRGAESNLPSIKTDGYAYFCTDTGSFYIDHFDTENALIRTKISAQFADMLRYTKDGQVIEINPENLLTKDDAASNVCMGECQTTADVATKEVTNLSGNFAGALGDIIYVTFTYTNTATAPVLSIDGKTYSICHVDGSYIPTTFWSANGIVGFICNGVCVIPLDNTATINNYGLTGLWQ